MAKKNKKKGKGINYSSMRCPYCGGSVQLRSADGIYKNNEEGRMLYVCTHYPECDSYVRVHPGTHTPVGTMANARLRKLRKKAHDVFERFYRSRGMSKRQAYDWLACFLQVPKDKAHIGYMGEYYCQEIIKECGKYLKRT